MKKKTKSPIDKKVKPRKFNFNKSLTPARMEKEGFKEYKARRAEAKEATKRYLSNNGTTPAVSTPFHTSRFSRQASYQKEHKPVGPEFNARGKRLYHIQKIYENGKFVKQIYHKIP